MGATASLYSFEQHFISHSQHPSASLGGLMFARSSARQEWYSRVDCDTAMWCRCQITRIG